MKTQPAVTIQFSGYPLTIVETKKATEKARLIVIKPLPAKTFLQQNSLVDDPRNWDVGWFNNYE